uniref:DUF1618 domain-containing protein n=1 Tax=Aegilops tauschii TaxID=37682 RepID=M8BHJ1_AEGTA
MAGLLAGSEPLTARNGLLLVRLRPCAAGGGGPIRLAACNLIAGTCDVLPPLDNWFSSPVGYTVLTGEDCYSSPPPSPAPNYSTFFKVLIFGLRHIRTGRLGHGHYNLHMFSSSSSSWSSRIEFDDFYITRGDNGEQWPYMEHSIVVDRGVAHYLLTKWPDQHRLPSYTVDMKGHVCVRELCLSSNEPTADTHLLALVGGERSLFLMFTEESLRMEIWTFRGDDGHDNLDWIYKGVMELKPPKNRRIDDVLWVWSGEKSNTLLIMDWDLRAYLANLETGAMEEMTELFYNTVPNAVPVEIDWPALFRTRLGRHSQREWRGRCDDADAVEWSCYRCVAVDQAINVDVDVADHGDVAMVDVAVVDVVVVYGVVIVDDEAAQSRRRKKSAMMELQTWTMHLANVKECRRR